MKSNRNEQLAALSRRRFLKNSGLALAGMSLLSGEHLFAAGRTAGAQEIRVGLIGCGGRGTGAAIQALNADPNVKITALGDVFEDRLEESLKALQRVGRDRVVIGNKDKYLGFDAYLGVIDSGVDVVLLCTPPAFRPAHFEAAVQAGKHVFCEKPVAVDAPGVRSVLESAKLAKEKNLCVVSGFCFRYEDNKRELFSRVQAGDVGDITAVSTFRNGGDLWYLDRQPDWTDMTYQMRNWYYQNWLSGDFIVEMSVHSLDMMSWALGDVLPLRATGTGGRQVRTDEKYGNIYDHFAVEFEYPNGVKAYHFTRQQPGTTSRNSVEVFGTTGKASVDVGSRYEITGKKPWSHFGGISNMYQTQHDELFAAIRSGNTINDGEWMANNTMLAILARDVSYTGITTSWEDAIQSDYTMGPKISEYDWDLQWPNPEIAIPGVTKLNA